LIGIIDYGMGNLRSVEKAIEHLGGRCRILSRPTEAGDCSGIILPGVGAFAEAMENLRSGGWVETIRELTAAGRQFLGICLGLQLLFTRSEEGPGDTGLDLLPGRVVRLPEAAGIIPHMGWNQLRLREPDPLFAGIAKKSYVYFVHSYVAVPDDLEAIAAVTDYGGEFVSAVSRGNIHGLQFHPEKSQRTGLRILANFVALTNPRTSRKNP
jgi:imidazole glycerol-phosphate synthase subunit HisH